MQRFECIARSALDLSMSQGFWSCAWSAWKLLSQQVGEQGRERRWHSWCHALSCCTRLASCHAMAQAH